MTSNFEDMFPMMCVIDENKKEFYIENVNDFDFIYSIIDQLRTTNSSIKTVDCMGEEKLLKAKTIRFIYLRNRENIKVKVF